MPDEEQSGPSRVTIALIVVLALPVVLVLMFLVVGHVQSGQSASLPQLQTKGLKWAQTHADSAGFSNVKAHDALGRDRGQRDSQNWYVCFQSPPSGSHPRNTEVDLAVVQLSEKCPSTDQGTIAVAGKTMPNLINRTAYMARQSLGNDASIRFVDVTSQNEVSHGLGDYRICTQEPAAGQAWDGVPVKAAVIPYAGDCAHPGGAAATEGPAAILNRVLDSIS